MLRQARRRAESAGLKSPRVAFLQAELPEWRPPSARFDAIVTAFFLDCFAPGDLETVVTTLAAAARPRARWLVADFTIPAQGLARQRARAVHALMYAFFRRVTRLRARCVTDPDPFLRAHGFGLVGRRTMEWGLLRSDLWARRPSG
jgi:ubiquinone/menaquinone biosynthesis C-methylase UbiE